MRCGHCGQCASGASTSTTRKQTTTEQDFSLLTASANTGYTAPHCSCGRRTYKIRKRVKSNFRPYIPAVEICIPQARAKSESCKRILQGSQGLRTRHCYVFCRRPLQDLSTTVACHRTPFGAISAHRLPFNSRLSFIGLFQPIL